MKTKNLLVVGTGEDPVFVFAHEISSLLSDMGYEVRSIAVIGLGVIGGTVMSNVRFGTKVETPLFDVGRADVVLSFDALETVRIIGAIPTKATVISAEKYSLPTTVTGLTETLDVESAIGRLAGFSVERIACREAAGLREEMKKRFVGVLNDIRRENTHG